MQRTRPTHQMQSFSFDERGQRPAIPFHKWVVVAERRTSPEIADDASIFERGGNIKRTSRHRPRNCQGPKLNYEHAFIITKPTRMPPHLVYMCIGCVRCNYGRATEVALKPVATPSPTNITRASPSRTQTLTPVRPPSSTKPPRPRLAAFSLTNAQRCERPRWSGSGGYVISSDMHTLRGRA